MRYKIIKRLIDWVEKYEYEFPEKDWDEYHFLKWASEMEKTEHKPFTTATEDQETNGWIAMLLGFMYKYAAFYGRKLFKNNVIYSFDDFGVLVTLYPNQKLSKTEVMRQNIMEKSSGNEVLKRMLKKGLLEESENPKDKRSKHIQLTDTGRKALEEIRVGIGNLSKVVTGDLNQEEKIKLMHLLSKLHGFHKPIFEEESSEEVNKRLGLN